jgi:hypothetical protein
MSRPDAVRLNQPVDIRPANPQSAEMRTSVLIIVLFGLAACSGDPKAMGITGPGPQAAPVAPSLDEDGGNPIPGVSTTGSQYAPSIGPIKGNTGFYGYN